MPTAREKFFKEFGHGELDHRAAMGDADAGWIAASIRMTAGKAWPSSGPPDYCGWWWCREMDDGAVRWDDLAEALRILRSHEIDPSTTDAANIANRIVLMDGWGVEKDGYERLHTALLSVDLDGDAERLQQEFLSKVEPLLQNARIAKPDQGRRGPPTNTGLRWALSAAEDLGWVPEDVAAIVFMVGVDRGDFGSIKKKIGQMYARTKMAVVKD